MIITRPGAVFEASTPPIDSGLVGTIGVRIMDGQGATTTARSTDAIVETPAGSGIYVATRTAPGAGDYLIAWDTGGDAPQYLSEDLRSIGTATLPIGDSPASYCTPAELRAKYPKLDNTDKYPDEMLAEAIASAEETIERECDVAFIPREVTRELFGVTPGLLGLRHNRVREVLAVSGSSSGDLDLTGTRITAGYLEHPRGWPSGETIIATYTHGWDAPPLRILNAAKLYARSLILNGPIDTRATQLETAGGGVINLLTPGLRGSVTGIPEVDAAIAQYRCLT